MSVVVFGYRNESTAVAAVASVREQAAADLAGSEAMEIIFVTSGGDSSAALVRAHATDVTVIESPTRWLPGAARNAGVAATTGPVVAFLEADCEAEPGWLASRLEAHRGGHPVVASAMTCSGPSRPWSWAGHYTVFRARLPGQPAGPLAPDDPAAHGLSFARDVLDRIGPFDETLRIGEDTDTLQRLRDLGIDVWFEPQARTGHRGPRSTRELLADAYHRGRRSADYARLGGERVDPVLAVVRFVPRWLRELYGTVVSAWRRGRGERWRIVVALPWIAIATAARRAGYTAEQLRTRDD